MIVNEHFLSQETATYVQVTHYQDSSPMQDVYCDGILYRKQDGLYFRRAGAAPLNVLWFGLQNDGVTYNQDAFQNLLDTVRGPLNLFFPQGIYRFGPAAGSEVIMGFPAAISLYNRDITITGEMGTVLQIDAGCIGIQSIGGSGGAGVRLENFTVAAMGKDLDDGHPNRDGSIAAFSTNFGDDYKFNGINLYSQGYLKNVNVNGFSGHGVAVYGATEVHPNSPHVSTPGKVCNWTAGPGFIFHPDDPTVITDYSSEFARIQLTVIVNGVPKKVAYHISGATDGGLGLAIQSNEPNPALGRYNDAEGFFIGGALNADNCQFQGINNFDSNGGCGLVITGNDSNQGTYLGVSVRENGFWGILDNSFLGSHFVGAHGTSNGRHFNDPNVQPYVGAFCTKEGAARSTWVGCYSEQGQGPSLFVGETTVIGGLHAAGIEGPGFTLIGHQANYLDVGQIQLRSDHLALVSDGHPNLVLNQTVDDNRAWGYKMSEYGPSLLAFFDNQTSLPVKPRTLAAGGISIPTLLAAGVQYGAADSITELLGRSGLQFYAGDYYVNTSCDGTTPAGWRCISGGTNGTLPAGITGAVNSNVFEFTASAEGVLRAGDRIQLGTANDVLQLKYPTPSSLQGPAWIVAQAHPQQQNGTLPNNTFPATYVAPRLRAEGDGVGPLAQRPTMRADDAGWRYFDTDSNTWSTWTGSAWV